MATLRSGGTVGQISYCIIMGDINFTSPAELALERDTVMEGTEKQHITTSSSSHH